MTADTIERVLSIHAMGGDFADIILVTINAIVVQHLGTGGLDLDWFVEILERKPFRMVVSIAGLGQPFPHEFVRDVAIVAGGLTMVTGLLPAIVLIPHDVAIHAGTWIIGEIGKPLGIKECVTRQPSEYPYQDGQGNFHKCSLVYTEPDLNPLLRKP
jgi:hypothetical protein